MLAVRSRCSMPMKSDVDTAATPEKIIVNVDESSGQQSRCPAAQQRACI